LLLLARVEATVAPNQCGWAGWVKNCLVWSKHGAVTCEGLLLTIGIGSRSQRLHWTLPHFGTTALVERWSDLMPLMSWQLWLARGIVKDNPLPWQQFQTKLTRPTSGSGFSSHFSGDWHTCG